MDTVAMTVRLPVDVYEQLVDHRRQTIVPTSVFVRAAVVEKLKREQPAKSKPKRVAASA